MNEEEIKYAFWAMEEYKRKRALKALFEKESIAYEIEDFNYMMQVFCWIKTLICLLLNRTNGCYRDAATR